MPRQMLIGKIDHLYELPQTERQQHAKLFMKLKFAGNVKSVRHVPQKYKFIE